MEDRLLPVRHDASRLPRPLGHEVVNKTLEGYPGARYHAGGRFVDVIEQAAVDRACELFGCAYANTRPPSTAMSPGCGQSPGRVYTHALAATGVL